MGRAARRNVGGDKAHQQAAGSDDDDDATGSRRFTSERTADVIDTSSAAPVRSDFAMPEQHRHASRSHNHAENGGRSRAECHAKPDLSCALTQRRTRQAHRRRLPRAAARRSANSAEHARKEIRAAEIVRKHAMHAADIVRPAGLCRAARGSLRTTGASWVGSRDPHRVSQNMLNRCGRHELGT